MATKKPTRVRASRKTGLSYGGGLHDVDIDRARAADPGTFHSDVGHKLEALGWHQDDVIALTNRDSIAREIERLRKRGESYSEVARRLHAEMKKTFGAPATRRGYAGGQEDESRRFSQCVNYKTNPLGDCGGRAIVQGKQTWCERCFNRPPARPDEHGYLGVKLRRPRKIAAGRAGGMLGKNAPADGISIGDTLVYTIAHPAHSSNPTKRFRGRVVMRGPAGWVVNTGGRYGTPDVVADERIVRVIRAKPARGIAAGQSVPSVNTIVTRLGPMLKNEYGADAVKEKATQIRRLMQLHVSPGKALRDIDKVLKTHGVEYADGYGFEYANTGDTYAATVIHDGSKFIITSMGDMIESMDRRRGR